MTDVRVALIGSGRMGLFHAETLAHRLPGVRLVAVADPAPPPDLAARLGIQVAESDAGGAGAAGAPVFGAAEAGARGAAGGEGVRIVGDAAEVFDDVDAVVIAAPARFHAGLVVAAAEAGRAVFCEKPMGMNLAELDQAIAAADEAGVALQIGFNRRFAPAWQAARRLVDDGTVGLPRLLRSVTRDAGVFDPAWVAPGTIFLETLIHDFDTLRFLNPGARAVSVYATADALVEPAWRDRGLMDTAVVTVRFDNGAIGTAEACFEASYGYDVRGEVLGSGGMATTGDGARSTMTFAGSAGRVVETVRGDQELFAEAYIGELRAFTDAVRTGSTPAVTGEDARAALEIALAAWESVRTGQAVTL